jgi:hypothetical protein
MIMQDYIILGALVGIGADIIKLSVNLIGKLLNFTPVVFWQLVSTRFLDKKDLFNPLAYLIGGIADITVSALLGIVFVYFIYYLGSKHLWLKGIGFGLSVWVVVFGMLLGPSVQTNLPQQPLGIVVTIAAHLSFGLALALLTRGLHLEKTKITKKKPKIFRFAPEPARKGDNRSVLIKPRKIEKIIR